MIPGEIFCQECIEQRDGLTFVLSFLREFNSPTDPLARLNENVADLPRLFLGGPFHNQGERQLIGLRFHFEEQNGVIL